MAPRNQLSIKELQQYPAEVSKIEVPVATSEGFARVGKGRDGPFDLHFKTYGHGPIRILWISGHGAGPEEWYPFVRRFGVKDDDRYTSLIYEARGIGQSGSPWSVWSMKDLAGDAKDLLDHVGWTQDKSVNVIGHSMGGATAMRLAVSHPQLLASLVLMSTTSNTPRNFSFVGAAKSTLTALNFLSTADARLDHFKSQLFSQEWLRSKPDAATADEDNMTGRANPFPTNGDAWAATILQLPVNYKAAVLQAPAMSRHRVQPADLRSLASPAQLGAGRIVIVHGADDVMMPVRCATETWAEMGGQETGVKMVLLDGVRHMPHFERRAEFVRVVEELICQ